MTGRGKFRRFRPIIQGLNKGLSFLPRWFFLGTWFLVDAAPGLPGVLARYLYAKRLAKSCGENVMIGKRCVIVGWEGLEVGDNVTIHTMTYLDATGGILIGSNVSIAHSSSVLSFEHSWGDASLPIKYNPLDFQRVEISDDVWIGCAVRILAGARLARRSIVGAGAIVKKGDYEGGGLYVGVPATRRRALD